MGRRSEREISGPTQEIYELCCEPGAVIPYRTLRLECLEHPNSRGLWRITRDGEYIDTINTHAFHSAGQLQRWLDAVADGDPIETCEGCPLRAIPRS